MHLLGRSTDTAEPEQTATRQHVVSRFHDSAEPCFSIHSICATGAKYGLVPGRWMGPYALCRTVADIAAERCPDSLRVTVIESGGGAPCIDPDRCEPAWHMHGNAGLPQATYAVHRSSTEICTRTWPSSCLQPLDVWM